MFQIAQWNFAGKVPIDDRFVFENLKEIACLDPKLSEKSTYFVHSISAMLSAAILSSLFY